MQTELIRIWFNCLTVCFKSGGVPENVVATIVLQVSEEGVQVCPLTSCSPVPDCLSSSATRSSACIEASVHSCFEAFDACMVPGRREGHGKNVAKHMPRLHPVGQVPSISTVFTQEGKQESLDGTCEQVPSQAWGLHLFEVWRFLEESWNCAEAVPGCKQDCCWVLLPHVVKDCVVAVSEVPGWRRASSQLFLWCSHGWWGERSLAEIFAFCILYFPLFHIQDSLFRYNHRFEDSEPVWKFAMRFWVSYGEWLATSFLEWLNSFLLAKQVKWQRKL